MVNPSSADLTRKVRQLDNDVQSIYELLAGIAATQQRHGNRFDEIATELAGHGDQLTSHGDQLATIRDQLASQGDQLGAILEILRRGQR